MKLEGLVGDDLAVQFQSHPPVAQLVSNGFPNRIAKIEIPIICLDVHDPFKRCSSDAVGVQDAGMINAIGQLCKISFAGALASQISLP